MQWASPSRPLIGARYYSTLHASPQKQRAAWPASVCRQRFTAVQGLPEGGATNAAAEPDSDDEYIELPEAQHIIREANFGGDLVAELRAHFEKRLGNPLEASSERFCFDWWHVPDQYTLLRCPANVFFDAGLHERLVDALAEYGERVLGCRGISPLWLSVYVDGCKQEWHTDAPHGPFAFVLSLTHWEERRFSGGETMLLQLHVLDYWRSFDSSKGTETPQLVTHVPPQYGQLLVFDGRIPHGVRQVEGTRGNPLDGRVVLHGWFTQPQPFIAGALTSEEATPALNDCLETLYEELGTLPPAVGTVTVKLDVAGRTGKVTDLAFLANTLVARPSGAADPEDVDRLLALQKRHGGVIELDTKTAQQLLGGKSRPYSVIIVADAKDLRSQGKLKLGQLMADFKLVAKSFAAEHAGKPAAGSVLFARMEFSKAKDLFGRMGIQALPYLALVPPSLAIDEGGALTLNKEDVMPTSSYPWSAETIATWVLERTGVAVGEIKRPTLVSTRLMPILSLAVLGALGFVGFHLYHASFMRHTFLYAVGAIFIYWFSVSGGMFNIIRGVPLVGYDQRKRQSMLFMQGQGQLGAEGFIMGSLYTTVGMAVAALIMVAPKVKDPNTQRVVAYGIILVAFMAFRMVTSNHLWKTGMSTQLRGAKAVTTKQAVELLKDVEGLGTAGQVVRVNHGYARNWLVPKQQCAVAALRHPDRRQRGKPNVAAGSWAQQAARPSTPAQMTLEKQEQQFDKLVKTLTSSTLTLKRRTKDGQELEQPLHAHDIADAVAKQMRIRLVPEMVDLEGESLGVAGEYQLPLKLELASGARAALSCSVSRSFCCAPSAAYGGIRRYNFNVGVARRVCLSFFDAMATDDDAEIARLLAADNPEQYYEYDFGGEEGDSDDPDYGGKKGSRGKSGKRRGTEQPGGGAAYPIPAAAAGYIMPQMGAAAPDAAACIEPAMPVVAGAPPGMMPNGAASLQGPGMPALSPEQMQMMLQQQALAAAMAAGGAGLPGMTGLPMGLPPGISLEQASLMGLPIMNMLPGGTSAAAQLGFAAGGVGVPGSPLPGLVGADGMPSHLAMPGMASSGGAQLAAAPAAGGGGDGKSSDNDEFTATGRRKRKDTGKQRQQSRSWTDDEERLFLEALQLYGRDWKRCAEHVGSRDHRAYTSHAQKHFIKLLLRGEEVPPRVAATGRGYTLSGKPLDPNSAAARAYGLKPDLFARVAGTGKLLVGVHRTARGGKSPSAGGSVGAVVSKRPRRAKGGATERYVSGGETDEEDEDAFLAAVMSGEVGEAAEPTAYVRNRPRRQVGRRMQLGDTTESTDLTHLHSFVGPPGTGAPAAQPFSVTIDQQALLVMDFHAHLSRCEIIGLLGGSFDAQRRVVDIREAYPCRRAEGQASGTSVELCAESQVEVNCLMEQRGQAPVGWYHSHPVFEPRPSQKDNENQRNYQALCRDAASGLEPWVGAIVGPYDQGLESAVSRLPHMCGALAPQSAVHCVCPRWQPAPAGKASAWWAHGVNCLAWLPALAFNPPPVLLRMQSSKVQLWVVKMLNGELQPFELRSATTGGGMLPSASTEQALVMALDQLEADVGRVDLSELWRPYSRLHLQQPEGPPLSKIQKLRDSLAAHLPTAEHPAEVSAFLDRMQQHIELRWRVSLPPGAPLLAAPSALPAMGQDGLRMQQQQQGLHDLARGGLPHVH
ncbi:putative dolichyl-diphosphooligosaccharide--protein glycosyltransferase subunit 3B [Chlorella vulgaris]